VIRALPLGFSLFLGRRLGELLYYFDLKHKAIAYANIKAALGDNLPLREVSRLTKKFYQAFGQNLMDIFLIPRVDKEYMRKYVSFEGKERIEEGFKKGKGVIFVAVHEGSWELYNIICANLGFPFLLFVREQRYPLLNGLLNAYRLQKGCKIIPRQNGIRQLIQALQDNQSIGMTADQGGKRGVAVKFFGKDASMAYGAVRLALRYGAVIIPVFYARLKGPYVKLFIESHFELKKTGNTEQDTADNLQALVHTFEKYILRYPQEYLWSYRIWKYSRERRILILSDKKTGHLRQSQALAEIAAKQLKKSGIKIRVDIVEIKFKHKFSRPALMFSSCLSGKYNCQGCLRCLKVFLREDVYRALTRVKPDIVISCGSSLAPVNYVLSRENLARSMVIMRPALLGVKRFDLVVMARHDRPLKRKNVVVTEGALNLISEEYLKSQAQNLSRATGYQPSPGFSLGFLLGGDTKYFHLDKETIAEVIRQIKSAAEKLNADILVTTSRRTSKEIENLVKEEFQGYGRCKLLIIANEKNMPEAVGGILGLARVAITSPESVSMVSEAASSGRYTLVFKSPGLVRKHQRFIDYFARNKYLYLVEPGALAGAINDIWLNKPQANKLKDSSLVEEAIKRIL